MMATAPIADVGGPPQQLPTVSNGAGGLHGDTTPATSSSPISNDRSCEDSEGEINTNLNVVSTPTGNPTGDEESERTEEAVATTAPGLSDPSPPDYVNKLIALSQLQELEVAIKKCKDTRVDGRKLRWIEHRKKKEANGEGDSKPSNKRRLTKKKKTLFPTTNADEDGENDSSVVNNNNNIILNNNNNTSPKSTKMKIEAVPNNNDMAGKTNVLKNMKKQFLQGTENGTENNIDEAKNGEGEIDNTNSAKRKPGRPRKKKNEILIEKELVPKDIKPIIHMDFNSSPIKDFDSSLLPPILTPVPNMSLRGIRKSDIKSETDSVASEKSADSPTEGTLASEPMTPNVPGDLSSGANHSATILSENDMDKESDITDVNNPNTEINDSDVNMVDIKTKIDEDEDSDDEIPLSALSKSLATKSRSINKDKSPERKITVNSPLDVSNSKENVKCPLIAAAARMMSPTSNNKAPIAISNKPSKKNLKFKTNKLMKTALTKKRKAVNGVEKEAIKEAKALIRTKAKELQTTLDAITVVTKRPRGRPRNSTPKKGFDFASEANDSTGSTGKASNNKKTVVVDVHNTMNGEPQTVVVANKKVLVSKKKKTSPSSSMQSNEPEDFGKDDLDKFSESSDMPMLIDNGNNTNSPNVPNLCNSPSQQVNVTPLSSPKNARKVLISSASSLSNSNLPISGIDNSTNNNMGELTDKKSPSKTNHKMIDLTFDSSPVKQVIETNKSPINTTSKLTNKVSNVGVMNKKDMVSSPTPKKVPIINRNDNLYKSSQLNPTKTTIDKSNKSNLNSSSPSVDNDRKPKEILQINLSDESDGTSDSPTKTITSPLSSSTPNSLGSPKVQKSPKKSLNRSLSKLLMIKTNSSLNVSDKVASDFDEDVPSNLSLSNSDNKTDESKLLENRAKYSEKLQDNTNNNCSSKCDNFNATVDTNKKQEDKLQETHLDKSDELIDNAETLKKKELEISDDVDSQIHKGEVEEKESSMGNNKQKVPRFLKQLFQDEGVRNMLKDFKETQTGSETTDYDQSQHKLRPKRPVEHISSSPEPEDSSYYPPKRKKRGTEADNLFLDEGTLNMLSSLTSRRNSPMDDASSDISQASSTKSFKSIKVVKNNDSTESNKRKMLNGVGRPSTNPEKKLRLDGDSPIPDESEQNKQLNSSAASTSNNTSAESKTSTNKKYIMELAEALDNDSEKTLSELQAILRKAKVTVKPMSSNSASSSSNRISSSVQNSNSNQSHTLNVGGVALMKQNKSNKLESNSSSSNKSAEGTHQAKSSENLLREGGVPSASNGPPKKTPHIQAGIKASS